MSHLKQDISAHGPKEQAIPTPTHHVVELFLPLTGNDGQPFGREVYDGIRDELLTRFGGVTFFSRNPAEGLWAGSDEGVSRDRIVVAEVLVDELDVSWWSSYRRTLEAALEQDEILLRSYEVTKL